MSEIGHNSNAQLKSYVERVEKTTEDLKSYQQDIRDIYAEAKGNGFDVKALRKIVKLRAMDADKRREEQAVVDTYCHALGIEW